MLTTFFQARSGRQSWLGGLDISFVFLLLTFLLFPVAERSIFGLPFYWAEGAFLLSLIVFPIQDWERCKQRGVEIFLKERLIGGFTLMFLVGIAISYYVNPHTMSGWGELKSFYLLPVLLLFAIRMHGDRVDRLQMLALTWFLGIMAAASAGLIMAVEGWFLYDGRLAGPYQSPNYLAMLVAPGVLLAAYFSRFFSSRWGFGLAFFGLALIIPVLWMTRSYTSWVAVAAALGIWLWLNRKKFRISKAVVVFCLVIMSVLIIQESGSEKWETLVSGQGRSSLDSRIMIWRSAARIAADFSPWGIGTGRFQEVYLNYQQFFPPYLEWAVPTPHNLFLHFFLEGGFFALAGWVGSVFVLVIGARKVLSSPLISSDIQAFVTLSLALLAFYLVDGLADTPYMKNDLALAVWGSLGLLWGAIRATE